MRKEIRLLIILVMIVLLSACNAQEAEPTLTSISTEAPVEEPTITIAPTNTVAPPQTLAPTDTPEPTATNTLEPTFTFEPTEGAASATEVITTTEGLDPTQTSVAEEGATPTTEVAAVPTTDISGVQTRIWDVDQMEQIYIPAGEFIMGSDDIEAQNSKTNGRAYPEQPVHTVYLDGYWIDKYEVTNEQYALCVDAGVCDSPYLNRSETRESYFDNPEYADYPVIYVSWYMSNTYCEWAGRRLVTEAEWEKASRGTDGRKYPWGNDPVDGDKANFCDTNCLREIRNYNYDDGYADTAPVGSYPAGASPYGVMDLSGNVWEWTSTIIQDYPYDADDGREDPDKYAERVWRGGPWSNGYWWIRSSVRYRSIPTYWFVNLGFRCGSSE